MVPAVVGGHMGLDATAPVAVASGKVKGVRYPSDQGAVETANRIQHDVTPIQVIRLIVQHTLQQYDVRQE